VPARNGAPRPWTAAEIQTAEAMRGKHTVREIAETLGRPQSSVSNLLNRPERMASARARASQPAKAKHEVSSGIHERLGVIPAPEEHAVRKSAARETSPSGASGALEPILIVPDAHRPFHSKVWWDLLMQVGRFLRPKHLIVMGDFADFYSCSSHDKDPARANRLEDELADVDAGLNDLDSLNATHKKFVEGNHENRLWRQIIKHSPSLAGLVSTEKLLKLKERGWEFTPYKRHTQLGAVHYTHDVGSSGRNAVFKVLDTYQHSAVSAHAHRMQYIVEGNAVGEVKLSAMFGWGGDVDQIDYMHLASARKNWCLGMGVGYYDPSSGYSYLVPVPVVHSTCMVNGRLFRAA
jgi:hypothetical protein